MISVDEARALVLERTPTVAAEKAPLALALSRILRAPVTSDRDLPPFDRAAMDGFAVRAGEVREVDVRLTIVGEVRAGVWPDRAVGKGEAIRVMTGAPVPEGADAVVQVERTRLLKASGSALGEVLIESPGGIAPGQNIVPRGSEAEAGARLLDEGIRIGAAQLAVLASVGVVEPLVSRPVRVALLTTGDEVVDPGLQPGAAQIRNANGPALVAAIREAGGIPSDFGVVADDPARTVEAIQRALTEGQDVIVISGGVSAGDFDFVESSLSSVGVSLHVTAVRVKPGSPFVFGTRGDTLVFGLPGNPVSAQVTFELFVRPALLRMQAARACLRPLIEATLGGSLTNRSARRNYLPVRAEWVKGGLIAHPLRTQGSGDIVAHALANALAVLEPDQTRAGEGDRVVLYPLSTLLEV